MSIFQKKDAEHYEKRAKQERENAKTRNNREEDIHRSFPKEAKKAKEEEDKALKRAEQHEKNAQKYEEKAKNLRENSQGRGR
jgi:hypothetical protein